MRINLINIFVQAGLILVLAFAVALLANHLRGDGLPLIGDWSPKALLSELEGADGAEDPVVSLEEARALFLTQGAVFIDARSSEAYGAGHIQGALNLPVDEFEEFFGQVLPAISPDSLIITYCDGEACTLSKDLALNLAGKGFPHVRVLVNGWSVWKDAGLPVDTGTGD